MSLLFIEHFAEIPPFVVLIVDQFVGHGGGPLERQKQDSHDAKLVLSFIT